MQYGSLSLACDVVFMIFLLHRFHSWSCGFMASTIQLNFVFGIFSFVLALVRFTVPVTRELVDLLHDVRSAIDVFNFLLASMEKKPSPIPGIFEFCFFDCPFLFFFLLTVFPNPAPRIWQNMILSSCCLNFRQSSPGPHVSFWSRLLQQNKLREYCPRICQFSFFINIPIIVNTFFLVLRPPHNIEALVQYDDGK